MVRKLTKGEKIARGICVIMLFVCFVMILINLQDSGKYDYCVEWDGWIHLEKMVYNCYDFENQEIMCSWYVLSNDVLVVTNLNGEKEKAYACSRYVKSKEEKDHMRGNIILE